VQAYGMISENAIVARRAEAAVLERTGRLVECEQVWRDLVKLTEETPEVPAATAAQQLISFAQFYATTGRADKAEPLLQRAISLAEAANHSEALALATYELAGVLRVLDQKDEAKDYYQRAIRHAKAAWGADDPEVGARVHDLAALYELTGRRVEAVEYYRSALNIFRNSLGPSHHAVGRVLHNLGGLLRDMDRLPEAESMLTRALEIRRAALAAGHPDIARTLWSLGRLRVVQNRPEEARDLFMEALPIFESALGREHSETKRRLAEWQEMSESLAKSIKEDLAHPR
jgi:tetratricopeptide (TPR) repeat protein